jgi:hypothetical protein
MVVQELQGLLEGIYDVPLAHDVEQFLLTDRSSLPKELAGRNTDEQLLVAEEAGEMTLGLFLEPSVLAHLADANPLDALNGDNLADYWTALEGVSHFVYLAWNASHDRPVGLLELELQAEVDKYVCSVQLLRAQDPARFPAEVHRVLFETARVEPALAGERAGMYRCANRYAARFCRHLGRLLRPMGEQAQARVRRELRRFYRLSSTMKMRHIECLAC